MAQFGGKWHLGSFFNDSEALGGTTSSPLSHGFHQMLATVEVAPTAAANCECHSAWKRHCNYGHYRQMAHCGGGPGPNPNAGDGCCANYWSGDKGASHGVINSTHPSHENDAYYLASNFIDFVERQDGHPFLAQLSFHNCHIPFIGTDGYRAACERGSTCRLPAPGATRYSDAELDYYACLNELDSGVGNVLQALRRLDYYNTTMVWFTTDNGPEGSCRPEGRCPEKGSMYRPDIQGETSPPSPGTSGRLRGRKRDVWEGGHRVPGIISFPAYTSGRPRESWHTVTTDDFLPTIMELLNVERPLSQSHWHFDGVSVLPILRGEKPAERGIGWMHRFPNAAASHGYAFRYGRWKYVVGSISCNHENASFDCTKPQLYDLEEDLGEEVDLKDAHPEIFAAITANFSRWRKTIMDSRKYESKCREAAGHAVAFPRRPAPSSACSFADHTVPAGETLSVGSVDSREHCCGACLATTDCAGSKFVAASQTHPTFEGHMSGGTCHLQTRHDPPGGKLSGLREASLEPSTEQRTVTVSSVP